MWCEHIWSTCRRQEYLWCEHDRYDNTYNRSCNHIRDVSCFSEDILRFKFCPSHHGSAWLLQSTRKNVCTQRLFWLRDMISISLMRKRVAPKPQLRLLSRPLSFRCATHSGTSRLTFWRRSGLLCLSTFTMRKLHSQRTLHLHNYFVHNIRPCMDVDTIRRQAFI